MRKRILSLASVLVLAALPVNAGGLPADLHPDAYEHPSASPNALGNPVYCVTDATTLTEFCLNNLDGVGLGFNSTAAALVPATGNPGTTVGMQRINAYMEAFTIWAATLTTPETVWVQGTFTPLSCTATSGVLGAAGTIQIFSFNGIYGFGGFWPSTWYHSALVNRLVGVDVAPGSPDPGFVQPPFADDIVSLFNSNLGAAGCLTGSFWYYGFDNLEPAGQVDFMSVLLHEVAHGLGHANFIDENGSPDNCTNAGNCNQLPGGGPGGLPDIYTVFSKENSQGGKHWNQMADGERKASSTSGTLVWDGPNTTTTAAGYLADRILVRENSPTARDFAANPAAYGPPPSFPGTTADVVLVDDGSTAGGGTINDGCQAPINSVSGKIALVDRGGCTFVIKTGVAEAAGAVGVIVANNVPAGFPGMGGALATAITSVGITQAAGNALKAELLLGDVNATILADPGLLQGADDDGHVLLYTPTPFASGSSVSHWDPSTFPNTLMEPAINSDLMTATTLDLSPSQMDDIGWDGDVDCPTNSDDGATIVIDGCDSGVTNFPGPWTIFPTPKGKGAKQTSGVTNGGCYLADLFHGCVGATNHGNFVNCSANTASTLVKLGVLFQSEADAVMACVESADLP